MNWMRNRILFSPPDVPGSAAAAPSGGSSSSPSGAGGTSAPQASPAPSRDAGSPSMAPASAPSEAGAGDTSFDFIQDIFGGDQSRGGDVAPAQTATPQQPAEPPAAAQPAAVPPTPAAQEPQAVPQAPVQQAEAVQQQAAPLQYDPANPATLALGLAEHQAAAIEQLAQSVFRLEPAEIEALETNFAETMPKLLAKAAVFSQQQFLTQLGNIVPLMVARMTEQRAKHSQNENKFYEAWPSLNQAQHGEVVTQLGIRYRKMFPNATLDQMIEQLGPLVMTAIGAQPTAMRRAGAPQVQPQVGTGNGVRTPSPAGFVPAAPGQTVQSQQVQENPFAYMGLPSE